jgi:copper chaperone CopZ
MKTWTLEIDGMSCGGCVAGVRKALGRVSGAEVLEADVGRATSWIDFAWSDQTRALTIADRRGTLAEGVPKQRRIEVVLVRPGLGVGVQRSAAPDMVLQFRGTHMLARLPKPPTEVEELQLDGDEFH